jgi:hypothetical protein
MAGSAAEYGAWVEAVTVAPDGRSLSVVFRGPPEELAPLARVEVIAHDDCVQVAPILTSVEGSHAAAPVSRTATVTLEDPLQGRPVLGGRQELVRPQPGLFNVEPASWERAVVTPDDRHVAIYFISCPPPLHELDHVDVRYEPERIVLTVYVGTTEDVDSWKLPAITRVVLCELDEPVAGRRLVDGSPPPRGARDPLESPDSG